ncbi:MAG: zinc ribbon domain-containing protein [Promethearchaeia archaeon]
MRKRNWTFLLALFLCVGFLMADQSAFWNNVQDPNRVSLPDTGDDFAPSRAGDPQSFSTVNESLSPYADVVSNETVEGSSRNAKVATDSEKNIHIVWEDDTIGDKSDIYYRNFTYSTQKWGDIVNISETPTNKSTNSDIAVDCSGVIHISWTEGSGDEREIKYRFITSSFDISSVIEIAAPTGSYGYDYSSIATNNSDTITISWEELAITAKIHIAYYNYMDDILKTEEIHDDGRRPGITYSEDNLLHLIFRSGNDIKYLNRSGTEESQVYNLSQGVPPTDSVGNPDITYDEKSNQIFVCWANQIDENYEILVKNKSIDGAFPESPSYNISDPEDDHARIDIDNKGQIYIVYRKGDDQVHFARLNDNTTEQISNDADGHSPDLAIDANGSVHFVFEDRNEDHIMYRQFDTFLPQLNVTYPDHDSILTRTETITSTVEPDTSKIEFYYNDSGSWEYIGETNQTKNWEFEWNTTKIGSFRDIVLNATAYNKNGLDETVLIDGLIIDNAPPQKCRIIEITDDSEYYDRNSSKGIRHFNGTVSIWYEVSDKYSGIDRVELWNGSTHIMNNDSIDRFEIETDIESYEYDGNYTHLYIVAYDRAGNSNESVIYPGEGDYIIIDNIPPEIEFREPLDGEKVTGEFELSIETDLDVVNVTFWNFTDEISEKTQIPSPVYNDSEGQWWTEFDSDSFNGTMFFIAIARDGNNHTSHEIIKLFINNIDPGIEVIDLKDGDDIGLASFSIIVEVEKYTEYVNMSFRYPSGSGEFEFIASNSTFSEVEGEPHRKKTELLFDRAGEIDSDPEDGFDLKFWAIDDVGLEDEVELTLYLDFGTPDPLGPENLAYNIEHYNITLAWNVPEENEDAANIRIYRSLYPFDDDYLNALIEEDFNLFYAEMGQDPGDKYCIAKISVGELNNFTDTVDGPNSFHYLIILSNEHDNPSEITAITVHIDAEDLDRNVLDAPFSDWFLYFLVYCGVIGVLNIMGIKRVKSKFFKGKVKKAREEIEKETVAQFEKEEFDLDARVHEEEAIITGTRKPLSIDTEDSAPASFEEIEKEESKIDKCPSCGWILSSQAKNCPRCGWER